MTTTNPHARPAEQFHWLVSGVVYRIRPATGFGTSEISSRGQTVTITAEMLHEFPALELLGDADAQIERWGEIRFAPGSWPEGLPAWTPGTREEADAYDAARREAWAQISPQDRDDALREVQRVWGNGPATSRTLNKAPASQQRPIGNRSR